jgi:hypothetical protein
MGRIWLFIGFRLRRIGRWRGEVFLLACASVKSCFRVGLLALPLCGAAVTFFAAAKKVTKESSWRAARGHT